MRLYSLYDAAIFTIVHTSRILYKGRMLSFVVLFWLSLKLKIMHGLFDAYERLVIVVVDNPWLYTAI